MKTHEKTISPILFNQLTIGARTFDVVSKDDGFNQYDYILYHQEGAEDAIETTSLHRVTAVMEDEGLKDGNVIIALTKIV